MSSIAVTSPSKRALIRASMALVLAQPLSAQVSPPQRFTTGGRDIVNMTFASTAVGEFPNGLKLLQGNVDVVDKNGQHMLRASTESELLIPLPQVLPQDFTIELEFIPKQCCNPQDLAIEGTASGHRGTGTAQVTWHRNLLVVAGGGEFYQSQMPDDISNSTPGMPTKVTVTMEGTTLKMYTNGRRLYTLSDRKFVRAQSLWLYLGGQDDDKYAVYVSRIRIIDNAPPVGPIVAGNPAPPLATAGAGAPTIASPSASPTTSAPPPSVPTGMTSAPPATATQVTGVPATTTGTAAPVIPGAQPVTAVPVAPGTTTGTGTPLPGPSAPRTATGQPSSGGSAATGSSGPTSGVKGPALMSVSNCGSPGFCVVMHWPPVANAVAYQVYGKPTNSQAPGQPLKYVGFLPANMFPNEVGAIDPYVVPGDDMSYWVQALFADGSSSLPGPVASTFISKPSLGLKGPANLTANVSGTQQLTGIGLGSIVTWTWENAFAEFGYGVSIDVYPNKSMTQTKSRDFLFVPNAPMALPPNGVWPTASYSMAIPQGSVVVFCVARFRLDDPRSDPTYQGLPTPGPMSLIGTSCYMSQVP